MTTTADQAALPCLRPSPAHPPAAPALQRQLAEGEPLKLAVLGTLVADARVRTDGADVFVDVQIRQHVPRHPQALPLVASWHYPAAADPVATLHRAQGLAATLPAGTPVVLLGRGLEVGHHDSAPALRVLHVLGLRAEGALRDDVSSSQPAPAQEVL
jgi:hypothetical protein